jgi:uncharacterized protein (TIGR02646 family)
MKKIVKNFNAVPAALTTATAQQLRQQALAEKGGHDFRKSLYRHEEVLSALSAIYNNKCAFCESDTTAGAPLQVEHYRPKAKVTGEAAHPGYYWLGYEWSNLLLACSSCNNKKGNHFPVARQRALAHPVVNGQLDAARCVATAAELVAEQPLLLNPETAPDTRIHFEFSASGAITGLTPAGRHTVTHCGLDRDMLTIARKKVYDDFLDDLVRHIDKLQRNLINSREAEVLVMGTVERLFTRYVKDEPYFEFTRCCLLKFPEYFAARFQPAHAALINNGYGAVMQVLKQANVNL